MGQYQLPQCMEPKERLRAHMFGRDLKDPAHVFARPGTCTPRVALAFAARDVPPGQSWAFTEHRSMAEVIADETAQTV
jgi:hypothetical protein